MALFVVATPIGNTLDFTVRAMNTLSQADLIIGEELKVLRQILKAAGVNGKTLEQLNEHSTAQDIDFFVEACRTKMVALVSDCGTPGFCDPGADLVAACVRAGLSVYPVPGPSSLMTLLSVCGVHLDQFYFHGFLPAKNEAREGVFEELKKEKRPFILMETPYRCEKFVSELAAAFPKHQIILGLNLTGANERVIRARGSDLAKFGPYTDAEPIVLILPS